MQSSCPMDGLPYCIRMDQLHSVSLQYLCMSPVRRSLIIESQVLFCPLLYVVYPLHYPSMTITAECTESALFVPATLSRSHSFQSKCSFTTTVLHWWIVALWRWHSIQLWDASQSHLVLEWQWNNRAKSKSRRGDYLEKGLTSFIRWEQKTLGVTCFAWHGKWFAKVGLWWK